MIKLNLGCGNKARKGFVGVDAYPCSAAQLLADIGRQLPFKDNSVDEIYLDNVIEHIQDITQLMREIHRVSKDGAVITIVTPHFASADSWRDPTHVHHLSYFSMNHFEKSGVQHYVGGGFNVTDRRLSFSGIMGNIGRLLFSINKKKYESTWCFLFRPGTLRFKMRVRKK